MTLLGGTINTAEHADEALAKFRDLKLGDAKVPPPWEQLVRRLPLSNLINIAWEHLAALFKKVLVEDRHRFMNYLSKM